MSGERKSYGDKVAGRSFAIDALGKTITAGSTVGAAVEVALHNPVPAVGLAVLAVLGYGVSKFGQSIAGYKVAIHDLYSSRKRNDARLDRIALRNEYLGKFRPPQRSD